MITKVLTKDMMASMIVCNRRLEEIPQPCRGQERVQLVIPFYAYIEFIQEYSQLSKYLLSGKFMNVSEQINNVKKTHGEEYKANLYKAFFLDMAVAVGKEVWYSESVLHVVSTQISNRMPGGKEVSKEDVLDFGMNITGIQMVQKFMNEQGYEPLVNVSDKNKFQMMYIGLLVRSAFRQKPWSFSIN